jgi:hypothetical protein
MLKKKAQQCLLLLTFAVLAFTANATTYYISNDGNDSNSGTDASSAWQTINRLNSARLSPGDNVLFRRGDTFYGSIVVSNSGSGGNPITYGAYGSGNKPIITGFTSITSWNNLGGNIWESSNAVSSLPNTNMVVVNGVNTGMGRYPNTGYLTYQSHNGNSSITTDGLNGSNWTGAGIAIKKQNWYIETGTITNQSGGTIYFSDPQRYTPTDGFGFFIQNDPRTLDVQNEWYYNPSTKKLRIYSTNTPSNVQIPTVDELFSNKANNPYITITDLSFTGANSNLINLYYASNAVVQNCDISFAGINGITVDGVNADFENNNITDIGGTGIYVYKSNAVIKNNNLSRIGLIPGNARTDADAAISSSSDNGLIQGNNLETLGHSGIVFYGNNSVVKNNFVNYSCLVLDDGGGICTHGGFYGQQIIGNIVLNSIGAPEGTSGSSNILAHGIFLDDLSDGVTISNNSVYGCRGVGIDLHRASNVTINGNTSFNNGVKGNWMKGALMLQCDPNTPFNGINLNNNILIAKTLDQLVVFYYQDASVSQNVLKQFGSMDNNYYARPINPTNILQVNYNSFDLTGWQSFFGQDSHSKSAPKNITDTNDLRFEYNATSSSKTISLDANYIDVKNVSYNGSITLAPYSSAVLIRNGAKSTNQAPVAQVGADRVIQLPQNSVVLVGSGSDADGSVVSYSWSQISGPSTATITNASSAQAGAVNLITGIYQFQLQVTDNQGATGTAVLKVTVQSASLTTNLPPVVSVGSDRIIDLPKNSVVLPGQGSAVDGSAVSYSWTQLSGPSTATLINSNAAQAGAENLVAGAYQFQLKVTDSQGSAATSVLNVTVNSGVSTPNIPPRANVGSDRYIELPKNSIVLPGSGTDVDGQVVSYSWSQISGPSTATLINPNSAQAGAGDMNVGVYQFQLTVTDNQGATGSAILNVSVAKTTLLATVGTNRVIQLPKSSIVLPGNATDSYATVVSNSWKQISGPSKATITDPNAAQSGADNLVEGVYVFEFQVTNDQGQTSTADLQVTVTSPNGSVAQRKIDTSAGVNVTNNISMLNNNVSSDLQTTELKVGVTAYPNPFSNSILVSITGDAGPYNLTLVDALGRTVWTKKGTKVGGTYQERINTSDLGSGFYFLTVIQNNKSSTIKLEK